VIHISVTHWSIFREEMI